MDLDTFRRHLDATSLVTLIATAMGWLPHIAAVLTVVWMVISIHNGLMDAISRHRARKQHRAANGRYQ